MGKSAGSDAFGRLPEVLLDTLGEAVIGIAADGIVASWNAAAETVFGRSRESVVGTPLRDLGLLLPAEDSCPALQAELFSGAPRTRECQGVRADGSRFPARVTDTRVPTESAVFAAVFRVVTDLTATAAAAAEVELQKIRWWGLVSRSADLAVIAEPVEQRVTYASPASSRLFGWEPEQLVGELGRTFVHPEDAARVGEAVALVKAQPTMHPTVEFRLLCADGSYRWVEETLSNLIDEPGVFGLVANIRDIHDRRIAEEALRASEGRYRLIMETAQEGIWAGDLEGRTMYANEKVANCSATRSKASTRCGISRSPMTPPAPSCGCGLTRAKLKAPVVTNFPMSARTAPPSCCGSRQARSTRTASTWAPSRWLPT
jgi:PAS domain S-box-containing protein